MLKHNTAFKQVLRGAENRDPLLCVYQDCINIQWPPRRDKLSSQPAKDTRAPAPGIHLDICWRVFTLHWDCVLLFSVCTVIGLYSAGGTVGWRDSRGRGNKNVALITARRC